MFSTYHFPTLRLAFSFPPIRQLFCKLISSLLPPTKPKRRRREKGEKLFPRARERTSIEASTCSGPSSSASVSGEAFPALSLRPPFGFCPPWFPHQRTVSIPSWCLLLVRGPRLDALCLLVSVCMSQKAPLPSLTGHRLKTRKRGEISTEYFPQ